MEDNEKVLHADLRYALRMVRTGSFTPEQAAQTSPVPVAELYAQLNRTATDSKSPTVSDSPPTSKLGLKQ